MVAARNTAIRMLVKHCMVMTWEYNYTSNYYKETVSITCGDDMGVQLHIQLLQGDSFYHVCLPGYIIIQLLTFNEVYS